MGLKRIVKKSEVKKNPKIILKKLIKVLLQKNILTQEEINKILGK